MGSQEPEPPPTEEQPQEASQGGNAAQEMEGEQAASKDVEHQSQKSYENEEWYQKWLRRQKNKGRQIIEIGADRDRAPEVEDPSVERRLDPDDGNVYTFLQITR